MDVAARLDVAVGAVGGGEKRILGPVQGARTNTGAADRYIEHGSLYNGRKRHETRLQQSRRR
jgi:hypothetical protein